MRRVSDHPPLNRLGELGFALLLAAGSSVACAGTQVPAAPAGTGGPEAGSYEAGRAGADTAGADTAEARAGAAESVCSVATERQLLRRPQAITMDERVPAFRVATADCQVLDSREIVGKQPFVVVFFATWCGVCERKWPLLKQALGLHAGQVRTIFVSLDDADTWPEVTEYLEQRGVSSRAVRGYDFLGFSLGYNPFGGVPVAVVVGRSGYVVQVQVGIREHDYEELLQAMDEAIAQPAL